MWLFEIRDENGDNPVRVFSISNRKIGKVLNSIGQGQASFTIDLNEDKAAETNLREGRSQLFIYRNGTLYWAGVIMVVDRIFGENSHKANVVALGWAWQLQKRYVGKTVDKTYTATDAGAILWGLINDTQLETGGDLGITQGTIETSINLTITYSRQKISDSISDLVAQAGIDWEVTANKILNVYYPKGTDRTDTIRFIYPGNITNARVVSDATMVANDILALGRGFGTEEINSQVSDSGSISVFGLYQDIMSFKDVVSQTPLDNMASYNLKLFKSSRLTVDIEVDGNDPNVDIEDYVLGDSVRVKINHDNYSLNQAMRIFETYVTIDDEDKERVRLVTALV